MRNRAAVFRVVLLLHCTRVFAQVHQVSYTCHKPINDADEFILELRLKPSGDTAVTGLQSAVKYYYVLTTPNCSATLTDGTYVLSKSINVEDSDCGVTKVQTVDVVGYVAPSIADNEQFQAYRDYCKPIVKVVDCVEPSIAYNELFQAYRDCCKPMIVVIDCVEPSIADNELLQAYRG
ncbi:uncharacterized protein LOC128237769 [Mya arenaria]|uniref:uncharacterized protein LOC128237769 n=1 Tax=Mya arenaria TaxID=6604 RepID=UPI0022E6D774|nr:uncharacterized protein LOC128237769 [Mya arenaria]